MNIIIAGAGSIGLYIATILSRDEHNVVLVDRDKVRLQEASSHLDIATKQGNATNWQLLRDLLETNPDIFIALTDEDEANLVACSIAKQLGYPRTLARIHNSRYLNNTRLDFCRLFDVDAFVAPEALVVDDIIKYMLLPASTAVKSFANGAVQMRSFRIPQEWQGSATPLAQLGLPSSVMVGLIRRPLPGKEDDYQVIIPHGEDKIMGGDEVSFIGETEEIAQIPAFFDIQQPPFTSIVIAGGSSTAVALARRLSAYPLSVRLIDPDEARCLRLAEELEACTVIHHQNVDLEYLKEEGMGKAHLFVACSAQDETNILKALLAKEAGCKNVICMLSQMSYLPLIDKFGLSHVVSPRISAANAILSLILSQHVTSVFSLYENQIEIVEIHISNNSSIVGIPLSELGPHLPKDFLIAIIQNRGRIMIANGAKVISPGDTIIAISTPSRIKDLERIF